MRTGDACRRGKLSEDGERAMTVPTIFDACRPRPDVLAGEVREADFAADLAQVIAGSGSADYLDPARFFANTYPTRGLQSLLDNVCSRLSGAGGEAASIFRLDTSYGGGKSHGLIALCHAARHGRAVPNIAEFVDPARLPKGRVRIAAFDGENADPANGRRMSANHLAHTPWGEIASELGGADGYERVRQSDESGAAPGAETLRELFGGEPTLILLDELSVYLRKVRNIENGGAQLTAFLTALFKAVEGAPNAVLVYTLAIGSDGRARDAYRRETELILDRMAEAESVSARKATLLNPTEEDETVQVLRRRLFESIDEAAADAVADAYRAQWNAHSDALPDSTARPEAAEALRSGYPLHPEVLETLTGKMATLDNFQRVRGMLRLLARTISHLWAERPADATAIHLHHIDPGHQPIRNEIVTRLAQSAYEPAISNDISARPGEMPALAQAIDEKYHGGLPPYAAYAARTIFMHTLAFNEPLKGISQELLRYSALGPALDIDFLEEARKRFIAESAYLDDRPGQPMRFLAEANLNQIIRRTEEGVDAEAVRAELNDCIREIFSGQTFDAALFPGSPSDLPDEVGDGRPRLIVPSYDAVAIGATVENVPELIARIYERKGSEGAALRELRNNLVFVAAEAGRREEMRRLMFRRLALREMKRPERLAELAAHQQDKVRELERRSEQELALAVQQCYRHVFYPSRESLGHGGVDLAHSAIDHPAASHRPGAGQQQIVRTLRALGKLRLPEDEPDSPAYVRDHTPLRAGQLSTLSLRNEFRRNPVMPILVGEEVFIRGVRGGIQNGEYVYKRGELLYGPGDPDAGIAIEAGAIIFTMAHAKNSRIWPRPAIPAPEEREASGDSPDEGERNEETGGGEVRSSPAELVFTVEAVLPEALLRLWEQVRARGGGVRRDAGRLCLRGGRCVRAARCVRRCTRRRPAGGDERGL